MPNGYRRGGTVTRGGRTFHRRGTSIRRPATALLAGLIGVAALTGGASVGSPLLIAGVSVAVVGYVVYRNRRRLAPVGRRLVKRAERRMTKRNTRPVLLARTPAYAPRRAKTVQDPHDTGLGVSVTTWGKRHR